MELDPAERERRQKEAALFKQALKKYGVTAKRFAVWTGTPLSTVYAWTRKSRCIPPPKWAWRILELASRVPDARVYLDNNWME
jgi:DNA-binding transcriptional regulator YiaG